MIELISGTVGAALSIKEIVELSFCAYKKLSLIKFESAIKEAQKICPDIEIALQTIIKTPHDQQMIAVIFERIRKCESIWASRCLWELLGKEINPQTTFTEDDYIFSELLSELTDFDLELFCQLREVDLKRKEKIALHQPKARILTQKQTSSMSKKDIADYNSSQQFHYNEYNKFHGESCKNNEDTITFFDRPRDVQQTILRVNRLLMKGALQGGSLGIGSFLWTENSEQLFTLIAKHRPPSIPL